MSKHEVTELDRYNIGVLAHKYADEVFEANLTREPDPEPRNGIFGNVIEHHPLTDREIGERAELLCHRARTVQVGDGGQFWSVYPNKEWRLEHWLMFRATAVKHYRQNIAERLPIAS